MIAKSTQEFKSLILSVLNFTPHKKDKYTLYKNNQKPELGYLIEYSRPNYYEFGIADYTIPKNFSIAFENPELLMRFGTLNTGITKFKIENNPVSSFTPSSFFVLEKDLKGIQVWNKGQHFHGAEITIHEKYFKEIIEKYFPNALDLDKFIKNNTYRYLPINIANVIQELKNLSENNLLNEIYLESKILECIGILINELDSKDNNSFSNQINYGHITLGKNRKVKLTNSDILAIQKAHKILMDNISNPPTIGSLSKLVFLNEQKLKAGFSKYYHMSIGEFTTSMRMTLAANLLSTTDLSVDVIAKRVGYNYSANFSKMFKKFYGKTPLAFRLNK